MQKWRWNWNFKGSMLEKNLDCLEGIVGRNMDVNTDSGADADGNEEHVIGNWKKGNPC